MFLQARNENKVDEFTKDLQKHNWILISKSMIELCRTIGDEKLTYILTKYSTEKVNDLY